MQNTYCMYEPFYSVYRKKEAAVKGAHTENIPTYTNKIKG